MKTTTYPNSFASWFTGTSLCTVKHPHYGKHKLTPYQVKHSTGEYKNSLFKDIQEAFKQESEYLSIKLKEYADDDDDEEMDEDDDNEDDDDDY